MSVSLFLKDPASARYVAGGLAEVEELFGSPLPDLPAPEIDEGREVYLVHVHSRLRLLQQRFLETQLGQIGALTIRTGRPRAGLRRVRGGAGAGGRARCARRTAARACSTSSGWPTAATRRSTCAAWSCAASRCAGASSRCSPLLQSFYRRVDQDCRRPREGEEAIASGENPSLVASVIDDGFAFTETTAAELDLGHFLATNKRFRIAPEAFFEIQQVLVREAERRLREGDRGLLARVVRHLPLLPREHYLKPGSLLRIVLSGAGPGLPARRPLDDGPAAPGLARDQGGGGAAPGAGDPRRLPGPRGGAASLRARLAPARARGVARGGALARARGEDAARAAGVRVRRVGRGAEQRGGRHRAVPRPARLHAHLGGADLGARPHPGALRGLRRLRPHRRALRRAPSTSTSATA